MTTSQSIIIGFSLIAASILLTGNIKPAQAFGGGKYSVNSDANGVTWVLNTDTGELTMCIPRSTSGALYFRCGKENKN